MIVGRIRRELRVLKAIATFRLSGVRFGRRPSMEYWRVVVHNGGSIEIGDRCFFVNIEGRTFLRTVSPGRLRIGHRAEINSGVTITTTQSVTIGDSVKIGQNAAITDTPGHEIVKGEGIIGSPVVIGDNVWIGRGAMILPGVTIGDNSVIGAGAVVKSDIPANAVAAGVPARVLRQFTTAAGPRA